MPDVGLGWEPHKVMENVCLALLAVLVARLAIEWLRRRVKPHRPATGRSSGG